MDSSLQPDRLSRDPEIPEHLLTGRLFVVEAAVRNALAVLPTDDAIAQPTQIGNPNKWFNSTDYSGAIGREALKTSQDETQTQPSNVVEITSPLIEQARAAVSEARAASAYEFKLPTGEEADDVTRAA